MRRYRRTGIKSDELGRLILRLHYDVLLNRNFNRYPPEVKEDMRSFSIERFMRRGLDSFDLRRKKKCWSYFTHAIFLNYIQFLGKRYKRLNAEREFREKAMDEIARTFGRAKRKQR